MKKLFMVFTAVIALVCLAIVNPAWSAEEKPAESAAAPATPAAEQPAAAPAAEGKKKEDMTPEELEAESVKRCQETVKDKATVKIIMEKVDKAVKLVETEGDKSFLKFKGKDSEFLFCGTYIWIHTPEDTVMKMHPIKNKMETQALGHLRDKKANPSLPK